MYREKIYICMYREKKEIGENGLLQYNNNFADHVLQVINQVHTNNFVRAVTHEANSSPTIFLYTDTTVKLLKHMCCDGDTTTILAVDRTFNLGKVFVTVTVFKNLSLLRRGTQEHPLMYGPIMLHGNSTFSTYHSFFAHIAAVLRGSNKTRLVLGSDEETALVQSMESCFPEATLDTCTRHLRNNFEDYLRNKVGLPRHDRYRLSTMVFGEKGVVATEDSHEYEAKVACLHRAVQDLPIGDGKNMLVRYLNNKFLPVVLDRVVVPNQRLGLGTKWTTNNCESINHVLKQVVNWKPQPRPQLVEKLQTEVEVQHKDIKHAIFGRGNFVLAPGFGHFKSSEQEWHALTKVQQEALFNKLLIARKRGKEPRQVTSTNQKLLWKVWGQAKNLAKGNGRQP